MVFETTAYAIPPLKHVAKSETRIGYRGVTLQIVLFVIQGLRKFDTASNGRRSVSRHVSSLFTYETFAPPHNQILERDTVSSKTTIFSWSEFVNSF